MKIKVNFSQFDGIVSKMAREYGTISRKATEDYAMLLFPYEKNMMIVHRTKRINNGRRAMEAIRICLFRIQEYITGNKYDISPFITEEAAQYAEGLFMSFDPFVNEDIRAIVESDYDLSDAKQLKDYFALPIRLLLRLEKSMELWTEEYGAEGYFNFLEEQISDLIDWSDTSMSFALPFNQDED